MRSTSTSRERTEGRHGLGSWLCRVAPANPIQVLRLVLPVALAAVAFGDDGLLVAPMDAAPGHQIEIIGEGFGARRPRVALFYGEAPGPGVREKSLDVVSFSDTVIIARLRRGRPGVAGVVVRPRGAGEVASTAGAMVTVRLPEAESLDVSHVSVGDTVTLRGRFLGTRKGGVRIGSERARVTQWNDDMVSFVVPRRVNSGTHPVFVSNAIGVSRLPLAISIRIKNGAAPKPWFRARFGSKPLRLKPTAAYDDEAPALRVTALRKQTYYTKVRRCSGHRSILGDFFLGGLFDALGDAFSPDCYDVDVRKERTWTVKLVIPDLGPGQPATGFPLVISARDLPATSPVTYSPPHDTLRADREADDWWIVIGRDGHGVLNGQFKAVVRSSKDRARKLRGRFVVPQAQ